MSKPQRCTYKLRVWLVALLLSVAVAAQAQQPAGVGISVEFPAVGALSVSAAEVRFDLSGPDYPPTQFPAYYYPVQPEDHIQLTIAANTTNWTLTAEFTGLLNEAENLLLGAQQLEYSVDGSAWFPLSVQPVSLVLAPRATTDVLVAPQLHTLQLRLLITGNELPGDYQGTLTFSLLAQ